MRKPFYITTTLPYVNAAPHIGFALEIVQADVIARYKRLLGYEVVFNTGTDEHGVKIYRNALEEKKNPQAYVDENAAKFDNLKSALNLSYTHFIRTTDPHHIAAAQEFWKRCDTTGDIEKKVYRVNYCVGCELEKTDSELTDGKCPIHPNLTLEAREEENYFFKFSKYGEKLLKLYKERPDFVLPASRLKEIETFVQNGLADFSISRLKSKMPWGVPVPGDGSQVMYVWFDALINYISTLGWPEDSANFSAFWGGVQIAGKDNLRQQSAMWQAMLLSAGLPASRQIIIHGFITSGGQKMSKSLGNVIDPFEIVRTYGTDALRYWLVREMNTFEDGDFTMERFKESYNANLANSLGNLVSRVLKMATMNGVSTTEEPAHASSLYTYGGFLEIFEIKKAADEVWKKIAALDKKIQDTEPFKLVKSDPKEGKKIIAELVGGLWTVARELEPFLPGTSDKIIEILQNPPEQLPALFPRIE
ncbi:MAG: methionine--tRNA ligase [Patescibacteria group bacterium]